MVSNSNKYLIKWLFVICIYLFVTVGWAFFGLLMSLETPEDPGGYLVFLMFTGVSIALVVMIIKNLLLFQKKPQRVKKFLDRRNLLIHRHFIQDYSVFYVARKKFILLLPFLLSLILIGIFIFLTFKFGLFQTFSRVYPKKFPSYLKFLGTFYIFNFVCMTIYMTGYFMTGEILQRMFGREKRNMLVDVLFNYFYGIPFFLILTLLWVIFVLLGGRQKNKRVSLNLWHSFRSLSLYALFKGFQYYTYINLARISFSDVGVKIHSREASSLFTENKKQLLRIFIRAGAHLGLAILFGIAIIGWNSVFGFLNFLNSLNYFPLVVFVLFFLFLIALYSEQLAILFYYIESYHPSCSFKKIGLSLDPDYIPEKEMKGLI